MDGCRHVDLKRGEIYVEPTRSITGPDLVPNPVTLRKTDLSQTAFVVLFREENHSLGITPIFHLGSV